MSLRTALTLSCALGTLGLALPAAAQGGDKSAEKSASAKNKAAPVTAPTEDEAAAEPSAVEKPAAAPVVEPKQEPAVGLPPTTSAEAPRQRIESGCARAT